jgi:hypothetical protein
VPGWLKGPVQHVATVLNRLADGLYHCYDVPGLPRTITGRKRSDAFVVRVGGCAAFAIAARDDPEADLLQRLGSVPAAAWQRERAILRANQERQAKMRRFHLHRAAYLADLEARWTELATPP